MEEKKFQIFISSTKNDLKPQRDAVAKAILELGHFPMAMEMFSAADDTQWKIIEKQIDQSDYFLVISAHRYGSMIGNISYTEKEFDYAVSKGIPILGFIVDENIAWPPSWIDSGKDKESLEKFKLKIKSRSISEWSDSNMLNYKVTTALAKEINSKPRPGWTRGDLHTEKEFRLVDALISILECQYIIWMTETDCELSGFFVHVYETIEGGGGSGHFDYSDFQTKFTAIGMVRTSAGGRRIAITERGREFGKWLNERNRKCRAFWTSHGGWGEPTQGGNIEKMFNSFITNYPEVRPRKI